MYQTGLKESNMTTENIDMINASLNYWFTDQSTHQSPFPEYIKPELREKASAHFYNWVNKLNIKAKEEINDEIILEKFEEILFETALALVITEDEKITIKYPFMIKTGALVKTEGKSDSVVISRELLNKDNTVFLKVILQENESKNQWETSFELCE